MKKLLSSILIAAISMALLAGCGSGSSSASAASETESTAAESASETGAAASTAAPDSTAIRIGGLAGPTSMGLVKLMEDSANGTAVNTYEFADLSTDASAFVAPLASGEIDIAAVPSNLASVIYNNTDGGVQLLAVNTLGVLDIVERGNTVNSLADLKGRTIYATGQGATPEYTLRYLLSENGMDPDNDVTIQWCADTTEALSYITQDDSAIAMIPQPFVTVALSKVEGLRIALNLNDAWNALDNGSQLITGVLVVRTAFAEEHPDAVASFLREYETSVNYTLENTADAAALIEKYGIVAAAVAEKALPNCNITYMTGSDMKASMFSYLQILYDQNPAAVGGALPGDDFYYGE